MAQSLGSLIDDDDGATRELIQNVSWGRVDFFHQSHSILSWIRLNRVVVEVDYNQGGRRYIR
jgi:hypothetical protein